MSDTPTTIYQSIIDFQSKMPVISKNASNPFFSSRYADLAGIQAKIQKPLAEAGLGYIQETFFGEDNTEPTDKTRLKTTLFNLAGNKIESYYPINLVGKPHEIGSAITYAKRYALVALLGLIIEDEDEDDDGNKAQNQPVKESKPWFNEAELKTALLLIQKGEIDGARTFASKYKLSTAMTGKLKEAVETYNSTQVNTESDD